MPVVTKYAKNCISLSGWTGFFHICVALLDVDICKELIVVVGIEAVIVIE